MPKTFTNEEGVHQMKVAMYIRVSTDKQEADNQFLQLREFCLKQGYVIDSNNIYTDIISGKEESRPAYDAMFQAARQHRFDLVLFWDLSRFSRAGTLHTLRKLKELTNLGIKYHSYQEPYLSSVGEFKDVVIAIMATLAKIERKKISERTKAGLVNADNVGKRGKDKKPRKRRSDRGLKRVGMKKANFPSFTTGEITELKTDVFNSKFEESQHLNNPYDNK